MLLGDNSRAKADKATYVYQNLSKGYVVKHACPRLFSVVEESLDSARSLRAFKPDQFESYVVIERADHAAAQLRLFITDLKNNPSDFGRELPVKVKSYVANASVPFKCVCTSRAHAKYAAKRIQKGFTLISVFFGDGPLFCSNPPPRKGIS